MNEPYRQDTSGNQMGVIQNHRVTLTVQGVGPIPSFKNCKRAILDKRTGRMRTLTEPSVKKRMQLIEDAILLALYSCCPTTEGATGLEWLKRLRIALSGLSDDSLKQIPRSNWEAASPLVETGREGV